MQSKTFSRRNLLITALAGFTFFAALLLYVNRLESNLLAKGQDQNGSALLSEQDRVILGLPVRLKILGINVDSADNPVCLDPDRVTGPQKGSNDLSGQRPEENNNIIVAGYSGFWVSGRGSTLPMKGAVNLLNQEQASPAGLPVRLRIPKINVDAAVDPMGTLPSGVMEVPRGPNNVGWYKDGPRPGDNGSAVIDGHYGRWKNGEGSVFDDLNNLEKGDILYVEDENGGESAFVVRESKSYDPDADASAVFESDDGNPHLNLITCEGVWNKTAKSYSQRLVVFTDKK